MEKTLKSCSGPPMNFNDAKDFGKAYGTADAARA